MSPTAARTGLLTFAALATVALMIGLAATKRPCPVDPCAQQEQPTEDLSGGSALGALPDLSPDPEPYHSPPAESAPDHSAPADSEPAHSPPDDSEAPPSVEAPSEVSTPVTAPTVDVDAATDYVRAFYADLEQRRYRAAWPRLAEDLRKRHGSFEAWEEGFATTLRQSASDFVATAAGPATVRISLKLTAVDRDKHDCEVTRRFAVEWRLDLMGGRWRALHAEAKPLESPPTGVAASCPAEEPASATSES